VGSLRSSTQMSHMISEYGPRLHPGTHGELLHRHDVLGIHAACPHCHKLTSQQDSAVMRMRSMSAASATTASIAITAKSLITLTAEETSQRIQVPFALMWTSWLTAEVHDKWSALQFQECSLMLSGTCMEIVHSLLSLHVKSSRRTLAIRCFQVKVQEASGRCKGASLTSVDDTFGASMVASTKRSNRLKAALNVTTTGGAVMG